MKVEVSDKEVKITMGNEVFVSDSEDIIKIFKEAKDDRERRCLAVYHCIGDYFKRIIEEPRVEKKLTTLDVLDGCMKSARKFYNDDLENEIDELLGPDPYTPLY